MTQTIKVSNGDTVNFPDEMTDDQIHQALQKEYGTQQSSMGDQIKNALSSSFKNARFLTDLTQGFPTSSMAENVSAGSAHAIQSSLASLPDFGVYPSKDSTGKVLPYSQGQTPFDKIDTYKMMGVPEKSYDTIPGLEQMFGEGLVNAAPFAEAKIGAAAEKYVIDPAINKAKSLGQKISEHFNAGKSSKELLKNLGQGSTNMEQVSTSIGNDLRKGYDDRLAESKVFTDHVLNAIDPNDEIYESVHPIVSTALDKGKELIDSMGNLKVGNFYDKFKEKPSFQNAHNLQSELGVMIGDLESTPEMTSEIRSQISSIKNARDNLKNHMMDFLHKKETEVGHNISNMYKQGSDLYRDNVVPYLSSQKLRDITRNRILTVKNIHDIFDTPTNLLERNKNPNAFQASEETEKLGPINKIMQDMPAETKGKIVFSKTGAMQNSGNAQAIVDALKNAENNGYSTYFDDDTKNSLNKIQNKIKNLNSIPKYSKYGAYLGGGLAGLGTIGYALKEFLGRNENGT